MRYDPGYAWLGTIITLDVAMWYVWLASLAITRHALDPVDLRRVLIAHRPTA
jgi:hypothetical protein